MVGRVLPAGRHPTWQKLATDNDLKPKNRLETEKDAQDATEPKGDGVAQADTLVPEPLTPEQIEVLKARAAKADENWDRLLRTMAETDNFKKRAARDKEEAVRFANEDLIRKLAPVLDNFDMALAAAQNQTQAGAVQSLQTGVAMILQQLRQILQEAGLTEVDATGKVFDPNLHEAVSQQESADVPEGHVLQQLRRGYKLRDRLIRPASVVVAKKPSS